jgi:hypothetical protein
MMPVLVRRSGGEAAKRFFAGIPAKERVKKSPRRHSGESRNPGARSLDPGFRRDDDWGLFTASKAGIRRAGSPDPGFRRAFAGMTRVKHSSPLLVIGAEKVLDILSKTGLCSAVSVSAAEAKVWRGWRGF